VPEQTAMWSGGLAGAHGGHSDTLSRAQLVSNGVFLSAYNKLGGRGTVQPRVSVL